jgi:hypothetical protein
MDTYIDTYQEHIATLENSEQNHPNKYLAIMSDLFEELV